MDGFVPMASETFRFPRFSSFENMYPAWSSTFVSFMQDKFLFIQCLTPNSADKDSLRRHETLRKKLSWLETERDGRTPLRHPLLDEPRDWLSDLIKIVSFIKQQKLALVRVLASNFLCLLIC